MDFDLDGVPDEEIADWLNVVCPEDGMPVRMWLVALVKEII
jgi:hypothetical protein